MLPPGWRPRSRRTSGSTMPWSSTSAPPWTPPRSKPRRRSSRPRRPSRRGRTGARPCRSIPRGTWAPGQFYTVTVGTSAVDANGTALTAPLRVIFFTRERPAAQIAATRATGNAAHPETEIAIRFSAPVETAAVVKAFSVEPPVDGTMTASAEPGRPARTVSPGPPPRRWSRAGRTCSGWPGRSPTTTASRSPVRSPSRSRSPLSRRSCAAGPRMAAPRSTATRPSACASRSPWIDA